jgi:hypothetical protein
MTGEAISEATMHGDASTILSDIVNKTTNDIVIFAIIILIGLIGVMVPLYRMILTSRSKEHKLEADERERLMGVIERNTSAFTNLNSTIRHNNEYMTHVLAEITKQTDKINGNVFEVLQKQDRLLNEYNDLKHGYDDLKMNVIAMTEAVNAHEITSHEVLDKQDALISVSEVLIDDMAKVTDAINEHTSTESHE